MDDLVQWLGQQLDEDERIARAACEYAEAEWRIDEDGETVLWWPPEPRVAEKEREKGLPVVSDRWRGQTIESSGIRIAPHIVRHDPARVLREIDAKRRILDECTYWHDKLAREAVDPSPVPFPALGEVLDAVTPILRALALPYADRPGYRDDWRP